MRFPFSRLASRLAFSLLAVAMGPAACTVEPNASSSPEEVSAVSQADTAVSSPSVNLAAGKPTSQSSNYFAQWGDYSTGASGRAVDGNTDGNFGDGSVTHTNADAQAWWQVDLQNSYRIGNVVLSNRTDCCSARLGNFNLLVSDDGNQWQAYPYAGTAPAQVSFTVNRSARYVKVQLNGTNYLSLAEVQVFPIDAIQYNFSWLSSGPCRTVSSPADGQGIAEPASCPSGYSQVGYGETSAYCPNFACQCKDWESCQQAVEFAWGCPASYPWLPVKVRECVQNGPPLLSYVSGNNQTAARLPQSYGAVDRIATFAPLMVTLKDWAGKPVSGASVTWSTNRTPGPAIQLPCQLRGVTCPTGSTAITTTDANGNTELDAVEGYYSDGSGTVTASYGGQQVTFSLTLAQSAAPNVVLSLGSGNGQSVVQNDMSAHDGLGCPYPGGAFFGPLTVTAADGSGRPLAGIPVGFSCSGVQCSVNPWGPSSGTGTEATTDSTGTATLSQMGGGSVFACGSGSLSVTAWTANGNSVVFNLTAAPPPPPPPPLPAVMTLISGNNQTATYADNWGAPPKTALFQAMNVSLKDPSGQPISGAIVNWSVNNYAFLLGCQAAGVSCPTGTTAVTWTDGNGNTSMPYAKAFYQDTTGIVTASYGAASAQFTLTAVGTP